MRAGGRRRPWAVVLLALAGLSILLAGCRRPPATPVQRDVVYGQVGRRHLRLDVYPAPGPGPHPGVLLIHGGGWQTGDKSAEAPVAALLTARGLTCFAINYRLAPRDPFPAQVLDCARAVRWVRAHAAEYQVDGSRLGAWGDSAGAHLALLLGLMPPQRFPTPNDPNLTESARVQAVVDFYGPADFRDPNAWPLRTLYIARAFFGANYGEAGTLADASPAAYVNAASAPVLVIHGECDQIVPVQQSRDLHAALVAVGVGTKLITVPGARHNLDGVSAGELRRIYVQAADWLAARLAARP